MSRLRFPTQPLAPRFMTAPMMVPKTGIILNITVCVQSNILIKLIIIETMDVQQAFTMPQHPHIHIHIPQHHLQYPHSYDGVPNMHPLPFSIVKREPAMNTNSEYSGTTTSTTVTSN